MTTRSDDLRDEPAQVTVVPYPDGPLIIRGNFALEQPDGTPIGEHGAAVALCRCGRSALKPFCDGSHKYQKRSGHGKADR